MHDYAQIYLDGKLVGTLDRRLGEKQMNLEATSAKSQLDILVENTGRINFATMTSVAVLRGERQGITKQVTLDGKTLSGWEIYSLPMKDPTTMTYSDHPCEGPCFYRATFNVENPADTFLDTTSFAKGTSLAEWSRVGPCVECGTAEDALCARALAQEGC